MNERRNYAVYVEGMGFENDVERVVSMTKEQARAIEWFMEEFDVGGCIELAENYEAEEI